MAIEALPTTSAVLILATYEDDGEDDEDADDEMDDNSFRRSTKSNKGGLPRDLQKLFGSMGIHAPAQPPSYFTGGAASSMDFSSSSAAHLSGHGWIHTVGVPSSEKRQEFFMELIEELGQMHIIAQQEAVRKRAARSRKKRLRKEVLPIAPPRPEPEPEPERGPDPTEIERKAAKLEHLKRELRQCLRKILSELKKDKRYSYFWHPGK